MKILSGMGHVIQEETAQAIDQPPSPARLKRKFYKAVGVFVWSELRPPLCRAHGAKARRRELEPSILYYKDIIIIMSTTVLEKTGPPASLRRASANLLPARRRPFDFAIRARMAGTRLCSGPRPPSGRELGRSESRYCRYDCPARSCSGTPSARSARCCSKTRRARRGSLPLFEPCPASNLYFQQRVGNRTQNQLISSPCQSVRMRGDRQS